ncbi:putative phage tail protein [Megasphaera elsdenii]|uniref:DUF2313 domain-containing protein n=1 Tax=Megasphaera elsdenii TaxID=907 RepID=A0A848ENS2_MEGEL|nr:putative phage tail protein [Megasphaera elsdenii]NMK38228.1 DUF2313 domain-containing protein [Megasphaera elsdenii]
MSFIRNNICNIGKYLPKFIQKSPIFSAVVKADNQEHDRQRLILKDLLNQFFVVTATWGLDGWERVLGIKTNKELSDEQRRNTILLKLQSHRISTVEFMTKLASRYYSDTTNVSIEEDNSHNAFRILADSLPYDWDGLKEALETYKPAHLGYLFVHYLDGICKQYHGAVLQTSKVVTIKPNTGIQDIALSMNKLQLGIVSISKTTHIKAKGI